MLTIPPHTSHRLQPLDKKTVFGPFKSSYNRSMDGWLRSNPGKTVTIYEIPSFAEADFAPATLTDRDISDVNPMQLMADIPNELEANTSTTSIEVPQVDMIDSHETLQPGTSNSHALHTRTIDAEIAGPSTSATGTCVAQSSYHTSDQVVGPPEMVYVSPGEIHSVPKAGPRKTKRSRKKGNTNILTSTPVRNEIALEKKKRKLSAPNVKKTLFQKDMSLIAEDSSEESAIEYAETSDEDGVSDDEIIEGDFVIVKVAGKSRVVHYIARIDVVGKY